MRRMKRLSAMAAGLLLAVVAQSQSMADTWTDPTTGIRFVRVEKGCYRMGTADPVTPFPDPFWELIGYRPNLSADEAPHDVCLDAFWIATHEVRGRDWRKVMENGAHDSDAPVAFVTWDAARTFAERLSVLSGARFRLPTEAEWEYACRAGGDDRVAFTRELEGIAWYSRGNARRDAPQSVGQLAPNGFGLFDMLGNVWEWTEDSYSTGGYARHMRNNPVVQEPTGQKVIRGGSFRTEPRQTRCNVRGHLGPEEKLDSVGFRLVAVPEEKR